MRCWPDARRQLICWSSWVRRTHEDRDGRTRTEEAPSAPEAGRRSRRGGRGAVEARREDQGGAGRSFGRNRRGLRGKRRGLRKKLRSEGWPVITYRWQVLLA